MAIEIIGVRRESDSSLKPGKHGNVIEWTEIYTVKTSDIETSHVHVMDSAVTTPATVDHLPGGNLPIPQVTVSVDGYGICQTLNGERLGRNPRVWEFRATWSSEVKTGNSSGANEANPEAIVPLRRVLFEPVTRYRMKDYGGQPYVNGAGTMYNPVMAVEEELARWEFSQFEPIHAGGSGTTTINTPHVVSTAGGNKVRPPGVYSGTTLDGSSVLIGVTDDTIHYFNGCINSHTFRWKAPYTLKLSVRDSNIVYAFGKKMRLSEYTITYDPQRWFDKPMNAGPYFLAPKLDSNGTPVPDTFVKYEYIYYTKDVEDQDSILSQDEMGPLGYWISTPEMGNVLFYNSSSTPGTTKPVTFDSSVSSQSSPPPFIWTRQFVNNDGLPLQGYQLVTAANSKKTYRANRPLHTTQWNHIERLNHFVVDFGEYMRVM